MQPLARSAILASPILATLLLASAAGMAWGSTAAAAAANSLFATPALQATSKADPLTGSSVERGDYLSASDHSFTYEKARNDDQTRTTWFLDGRAFTFEEVQAYDAANPRPKMDAAELNRVRAIEADQVVSLHVELRLNPWPAVYRDVRRANEARIESLGDEIRELQRPLFPNRSLTEAEEQAWAATIAQRRADLPQPVRDRIQDIKREVDRLGDEMREQTLRQVLPLITPEQNAVVALIDALGGKVEAKVSIVSGLEITLPASAIDALLADERVVRVSIAETGEPELSITVPSLGVSHWHTAGFTGGVFDAGLLDTGCQANHPAFATGGLTFFPAPGVSAIDSNGHGTSVTGIITSRDATLRGIAPGIDAYLVGLAGGTTTRAHGDWMITNAPQKPEVVNISFSLGSTTTGYHDNERWFDAFIDSSSTMVSKSTGNGGSGAQTITQPGQAYNLMGVANMTFQGTENRADDRITTSSSRGTTKDGRRKPDLTAPGQGVVTCGPNWATGTPFVGFGGTSAAAPHAGSCYLLVTDLRGIDDPIAGKAVLINTADAISDSGTLSSSTDDVPVAGSHWSPTYGWGYIDMAEALVNAPDVHISTVDIDPATPTPSARFYRGTLLSNEKATLVWNRHLGYQSIGTPIAVRALTDLDLFVYRPDGILLGSSSTLTNNVEQISVVPSGDVVLRVSVAGTSLDPLVGVERFALATEEGFVEVAPPVLTLEVDRSPLIRGRIGRVRATIGAEGDLGLGSASLTLSQDGLLVLESLSQQTGPIAPSSSVDALWRVRVFYALNSPATANVTATVSVLGESQLQMVSAEIPFLCPGEYDGVGSVDLQDLLTFIGLWTSELGMTGTQLEADFNADARVDVNDLLTFLGTWVPAIGSTCTP